MEEELKEETPVQEEKEETKTKQKAKSKKTEKKECALPFPVNMIYALITIGLIVLVKVLYNFGVMTQIFYGIVSIAIYALPIVGAILSYISAKKPNCEFYANVATLAIALICI